MSRVDGTEYVPGRSVRGMDGMHWVQLLVFGGLMLVLLVAMTIVLKIFDARDVMVNFRRQMPFLEGLSFVLLLPFLHVRNHQHLKYERR